MSEVKNELRQFILSNYLPGESPDNLRETTPLQTSGILDSLAIMGLAEFIMQKFGVELDVYDTGMDRFDRIEDIAALIGQKQALGKQKVEA